jgi:hypothetical protein
MSAFDLETPVSNALWMSQTLLGRIHAHFDKARESHTISGPEAAELIFLGGMVVGLCQTALDETTTAIEAEFSERREGIEAAE